MIEADEVCGELLALPFTLLIVLHRLHEVRLPIEDLRNNPSVFTPNWVFRHHRRWWVHRAISFPWFFGCVYGLFLLCAATTN